VNCSPYKPTVNPHGESGKIIVGATRNTLTVFIV
jgi:hypothetical protein